MVCLYCQGKTKVNNSRSSKKTLQIWRRRQCKSCGAIFTSLERPDFFGSLIVERLSGQYEPFSADKLFISIYESCKHRADPLSDARALTNTITANLLKTARKGVLSRSDITSI